MDTEIVQKQKKQSAAQPLGLVSRRVNGKLYPTPEQAAALTEQAIAVRQVQNAVIWRVRKLYDEKYGPWEKDKERIFCCRNMQTGICLGKVHRDRGMMSCNGTEKGCVRGKFPRQKEMCHWATEMIAHDRRLRVMSVYNKAGNRCRMDGLPARLSADQGG
jgi:hypothetical protein